MIEVTIGDVRTGFIDNPVGADLITPGVEAATCFDYWYDDLKRRIKAEALRDAANELYEYQWQPGDGTRMISADEQAAWMHGANDAHNLVDRLLRDRADRIEEA